MISDVVNFYMCKIETLTVKVSNNFYVTGFVDVSPEETVQKSPFESFKDVDDSSSVKESWVPKEVSFFMI